MRPSKLLPIAHKEVLHLLRDPRSIGLALGMPALLTLLFGWVLRLDVVGLRLAVVDLASTPESRRLVHTLMHEKEFREVVGIPPRDAPHFSEGDRFAGVLWIRRRHGSVSPRLDLWVDGRNPLKAKAVIRVVAGVARRFRQDPQGMPVGIRVLYNPELKSQIAIVPGLVALILLLVAALLPSITLAREFEQNTFSQLRLMPVSLLEVLVGKLLPYLVLGYAETALVLAIAMGVFGVPMAGSFLTLAVFVTLFLLTAIALGILFSALTRNQQAAMQFTWLSTFLPSFFLSGFVFPLESMPRALQALSYLVPARYFIRALRGVMLQGAGLRDLPLEALGQAVLLALWMVLALRVLRRQAG